MNRSIFVILFIVVLVRRTSGQSDCPYYPADCPDKETLQYLAEKKWGGNDDLKVKEEYLMQDRLRDLTLKMIEEISSKQNWQWYQFEEEQDPGIGINGNTKPLPYPFRPPCQWGASFVFIVNQDSLRAWLDWYNTDLQNGANKVVTSYEQAKTDLSKDDQQKKYLDSATWYGNEKAKVMTGHATDYQKAILSNDSKTQKKYEDEMKKYDERINACIDKANGKMAESFSSSENQNLHLQNYKLEKTIAYRNKSILRVKVMFNPRAAGVYEYEQEENAVINKTSTPLNTAGSAFSVMQHNDHPGNEWGQGTDRALILLGNWDEKPDGNFLRHAIFSKNRKNTDTVSVKKIHPDSIQAIAMYLEGDPKYIREFLLAADLKRLNSIVISDL